MIERFIPIRLEWNDINGWLFNILFIETYMPFRLSSSLFGINVSKDFFYIDLLWKEIKVFDKTSIY
jgi:hypothetical protein